LGYVYHVTTMSRTNQNKFPFHKLVPIFLFASFKVGNQRQNVSVMNMLHLFPYEIKTHVYQVLIKICLCSTYVVYQSLLYCAMT